MKVSSLKVLIVAQNASTKFGGEAILPVKYFQLLKQRGYTVKLIAHHRNKDDLLNIFPDSAGDMIFVPDSGWHRMIWRIGSVFPERIRETVFGTLLGLVNDYHQANYIRRCVDRGEVNIIHQPIPVSPRAPSNIYGFKVPVIIGPMNGDMNFPIGYEDYESHNLQRAVAVGRKFALVMNYLIPGKRRASALLVANPRTRAALPLKTHPRIIEVVENGVDLSIWTRRRERSTIPVLGSLRLVYVGRLIEWKGLDITLKAIAIAKANGVNVHLDIVGEGPHRGILVKMTEEMGLVDCVTFYGFLPQIECVNILLCADALILNSLRECGGAAVLEAMSLGLAVIVSNWGGPADYVDSKCGILVNPVPRNNFAHGLAEAISHLAQNPEKCRIMGEAGAEKVRQNYDWQKKIDQLLDIYIQVLNCSELSDGRKNTKSVNHGDAHR